MDYRARLTANAEDFDGIVSEMLHEVESMKIAAASAEDTANELFEVAKEPDQPSDLLQEAAHAILGLTAQLTTLQAKLEAAEKDAARYRFLRYPGFHPVAAVNGNMETLEGSMLDAAIDAALAQNGKE